ncbi:MAG: DUF3502 domain-containing protein [Eubacteriales bacterium]|nr:DUF3502 domain-containing protein [Eubacteriales bacterium]
MKKAKKLVTLSLAALTALSALPVSAESAKEYNGIDVSTPVELTLYYVGNEYGDEQMIFDAVNEIMQEKINATINFKSLSMSDYATNYSLLLAGGESIDLIYTSQWCFYTDEAGKGAFLEITDDMIQTYMPMTAESQAEASYQQGMIDGKLYYVPCNKIGYGHPCVLIRGDLREKYGLDELTSLEDLTTYMKMVAEDADSGVAFPYNASLNGRNIQALYGATANNLISVVDNNFYYEYVEGKTDYTADDIFYLYESDYFREFCEQMKDCSSAGTWSMSSINNQTDVKDSMLNGTSAVYIENLGTCGSVANSIAQSNPEWQPEIYDLNLDKVSTAIYDADGYAIPYSSKNVERALMALDLMKNDPDVYVTMRYGIPDYHITLNEDGTWSQAENYGTWSYGAAVSWGLKNSVLEMDQDNKFPTEIEIMDQWEEISVDSPTVGFSFSTTNVADAWASLSDVYTQYIPLLQLGLSEDIDGWLDEFYTMAEAAGLQEVKDELATQLNAYFEAK